MLFEFIEVGTKFSELSLDGSEHLPDSLRPLLDHESAETYAQAIEDNRQGGRAGNDDTIVLLKVVNQLRLAHELSVKALNGNKYYAEVGSLGRV